MNIPPLGQRWYSGDDKTVTITVLDNNDDAVLMGGASATFRVFNPVDGSTLFTKTTGAGEISILSNVLTVTVNAADTASLGGTSFLVYRYECEVIDGSGNVSTVARGRFTIHADSIP
jgi:hypothetical protein